MTETERYQTARKQVREQRDFWIHLAVFLFVNSGLITLNLVTQPDQLWFHWVLMGWVAGILVHGFKAFGGKNWEESKIKEFVKRDVLPILLLGSAFVVAGCSGSEVDYKFEVLKKAPDGTVEVAEKGTSQKTKSGDAGGGDVPGIGSISTGARKIGHDVATIEITYPDKTTGTLELGPKATKEHFHSSGDYGVRITVDEIRTR